MKKMYNIILLLLMMVVVTKVQGQVTYDNKVTGTQHTYRTNNSDYKRGGVQQQQQVVIVPGVEYQPSKYHDDIIAMELESKYYGKQQTSYNMAIQYRGSRVLVIDEYSGDMIRTYESDNLVVYATNEDMSKMKYVEDDELGRNIRTEVYDILYYEENIASSSYEVVLKTNAGTIFSIVLPMRGSVVTLTFKGLVYLITGNIEYNAYLKE